MLELLIIQTPLVVVFTWHHVCILYIIQMAKDTNIEFSLCAKPSLSNYKCTVQVMVGLLIWSWFCSEYLTCGQSSGRQEPDDQQRKHIQSRGFCLENSVFSSLCQGYESVSVSRAGMSGLCPVVSWLLPVLLSFESWGVGGGCLWRIDSDP